MNAERAPVFHVLSPFPAFETLRTKVEPVLRFECDYAEGAHPRILERLLTSNDEQTPGYGEDAHCENARRMIRALCGNATADVHFLTGGTQTNLTVIAAALRPHQGVLCARSGHIHVHETGAVEAAGHKILALPDTDGKLTANQIEAACAAHGDDPNREHTVQPGMLYVSHPTEYGTLYSRTELEALSAVCRNRGLFLYLDGARLGYALASPRNDVGIADLARLCSVFYIGGTKVGAMFGEAAVITDPILQKDFRYLLKQRGGLLAKGRFLGLQFETLLEDGLYTAIARHAVDLALTLRRACENKGYPCLYDSPTNQQFPILPHRLIERLREKYAFFVWAPVDETHSAVRFCTSWKTEKAHVEELIRDIEAF